jgi:hypothetical protein
MDTPAPSGASRTPSVLPPPHSIGFQMLLSRRSAEPPSNLRLSLGNPLSLPTRRSKSKVHCNAWACSFSESISPIALAVHMHRSHNAQSLRIGPYAKYASARKRPRPNPDVSSFSASTGIIEAARRLFLHDGDVRAPCVLLFPARWGFRLFEDGASFEGSSYIVSNPQPLSWPLEPLTRPQP